MNIGDAIDKHNELRRWCADTAKRNNGAAMGDDAWLRYALSEHDITLDWDNHGINCWGMTFTSQTMSNEHFSFTIPWDDIPDDLREF